MLAFIASCGLIGIDGFAVDVEVNLSFGIPAFEIVGLPDASVKESRDRVRSAIKNCGFEFPSERVLISLSPADLKKEGAGFDLAVALAVLVAQSESDGKAEGMFRESVLIMGELELSGSLRPVRGIHAAVSTAKANGINMCIVPETNVNEAMQVKGIKVYGAKNLTDAFSALYSKSKFSSSENSSSP